MYFLCILTLLYLLSCKDIYNLSFINIIFIITYYIYNYNKRILKCTVVKDFILKIFHSRIRDDTRLSSLSLISFSCCCGVARFVIINPTEHVIRHVGIHNIIHNLVIKI